MIIHVDMDAFFASVEQLDHPELRGKPVMVAGMEARGVVAAASYEARRFGVHSAMPVFQARQKCPLGIFVPPRRSRYHEVSQQVMAVLASFTPVIEPISIDEAFLDVTGCGTLFGTPREMGMKIKERISSETGLTCSVGIAPLKFLAKIASDMNKPDGLTCIAPVDVDAFIRTLAVRKISGVGPHTAAVLEKMGILTLGDVRAVSREILVNRLGKYGHRLFDLSRGIDRSSVVVARPVKSISAEETLAVDITDRESLKKILLRQSEDVGRQLRQNGCKARTVVLKVKYYDFQQQTRQKKLSDPTFASEKLFEAAATLLDDFPLKKPVRLIGVGVTDLASPGHARQMDLFAVDDRKRTEKWEKVDTTVDAITDKFGNNAIKKAGITSDSSRQS